MKDGYSGKGDFVPSYIVDKKQVSGDATADATSTGFGDGMYFTPQQPLFYQGTPQKTAADSLGMATSDGPHVVYDTVPGSNGVLPGVDFDATGLLYGAEVSKSSTLFDINDEKKDSSDKFSSDMPSCLDESGSSRNFGENWYRSDDPCDICTCYSFGEVKCELKVCDSYPLPPAGHKVHAVKVDDCCYTYSHVPSECNLDTCVNSAPVCQFYEDLQIIPEDKCCSSYSCTCNPVKCSSFNNFVCPEGLVKSTTDQNVCCSIPKCMIPSAEASASSGITALSSPTVFMNMFGNGDNSYEPMPFAPHTMLQDGLKTPLRSELPSQQIDLSPSGMSANAVSVHVIPGTKTVGATSYDSYVSDRHSVLLGSYIEGISNNSTSTCEFVKDSSACPDSCPVGLVCDGTSCVSPKDCPCYSNFIRRQTGAVWKEDNGCSDCICIGGKSECVPKVCDVISCPPGEKLIKVTDECCGSCQPDENSCESSDGTKHSLWEQWKNPSNECETCSCTPQGVVCEAEKCFDSNKPSCSLDEMLVTRKSGCCDVYECMCDVLQCTSTVPQCSQYESAVIVNPGECCPKYECVCRSEKCPPVPKCAANELLERTNADSDCCGKYICKPIGCTDESGVFHEPETTWPMANDTCQRCSCMSDQTIMCKSRDCATLAKPVCADGNDPTVIFDVDGCCPKYVCNFVCRGYAGSSRIHTFDGQSYVKFCPCQHVLVKDTFGLNFEVTVQRKDCNGGICTKSIDVTDTLLKQTYQIVKDVLVVPAGLTAFDITIADNKVTVVQKSTLIKIVFDHTFDTWSIHIPSSFAGKTEGLCGMADGDSENDFWIGGHSTTLDNFFAYWLVTPGCTEINAEVSAEVQIQSRQLCSDLFSKSAFADMASVVDINEYVETCAGIVPPEGKITSDWPGCSVFAAFASAASRAGKCVDWRTDDLCSYGKCSTGASYSACGPSTPKTCDNYKTYQAISVGYGVEGCNCDAGKVLLNGECVLPSSCPVCTDESGISRQNGEQWYYSGDCCTTAVCLIDGTITHNQKQCPAAPTCGSGEILAKASDESVCCPAYVCMPEKCTAVQCPAAVKPTCGVGEEWEVTFTGEKNCCLIYTCVCKPESCPSNSVPSCEVGEELEVVNVDKCCSTATCVCKHETCSAAPTCDQPGYALRVSKQGRCCTTYECVCDRCTCANNAVPTCKNGEVPVVVDPTACCPSYDCVCDKSRCPSTSSSKCASGFKRVATNSPSDCCESFECKCDVTKCPAVKSITCPSKPGYKILSTGQKKMQPGLPDCCPVSYESVCVCDVDACPVDDVTCKPYERKYQTNAGDCCPKYACECDMSSCQQGVKLCPLKHHVVQKIINDCCTTRVCECDACVDPTPCEDGWDTINEKIDVCGCKTHQCKPPSVCLIDGVEHAPGAVWMEDICTECTCESSVGDSCPSLQCTPIKCGTCSAGYTYVPVAGQCCGDCVPTVCHYNGKQYAPGQTWTSPDNKCTTCECMIDPVNNEVYSQCNAPSCPPIDDKCAPEDVITTADGCCTYCAPKSAPQNCRPVVDYVEEFELGGCKSQGKVNVTMCEGQCTSASVFSIDSGKFEKQCSCCSTVKTEDRTVDLVCPDGSKKEYVYKIATECKCGATTCGTGLPAN